MTAHAWYTRQHGSACRVALGSPNNWLEWGNDSTSNSLLVACAMPDSNFSPKQLTGSLYVVVDDNHTTVNVTASRCVEFWDVNSGACGDTDASCDGDALCFQGKGIHFLEPPGTDPRFWTNTGDHFAYVMVTSSHQANPALQGQGHLEHGRRSMSGRVRPLFAAIVVASGLVTAALVGLLVGSFIPSRAPVSGPTDVDEPVERRRAAASDRRRLQAVQPPPLTELAIEDGANTAPRPEETKRRLQDKLQQALQQHAAEPVDSRWAASTNGLLEQDGGPRAGRGFQPGPGRLAGPALHSRSRVGDTRRRGRELPAAAVAPHPGQLLALHPDTGRGSGCKTSATLMLNCESWRKEGAVVMEGLPSTPAP